ncbi:MAG: UDP-galactopyranose mutase [Eubacteriales bacterium]|nr:UDP-galactopyranose mutase [Eubacteriales bacterium]
MAQYDFLIVGAGLYGAAFAWEARRRGKKSLVIDKRQQVGGNVYTEDVEGIHVHRYGAHIFHTDDADVWDFVNQFATFNRFTNAPIARYGDEIYNMPFNMNTFHALWGVKTPEEAQAVIRAQVEREQIGEPKNLEEQALKLVGRDIYEKLVKGYTEKQWGRKASELPAFIIRRLPLRFTYDNNYFSDRYQGIPIGGYTRLVQKMLDGVVVKTGVDYLKDRAELNALADKVIYTGTPDALFDFCYGPLEFRSLRFETETLEMENYQGCAVVNYTQYEVPYTRIIEHKHFEPANQPHTVITREYPAQWHRGSEPYYPVNDEKNNALYRRYAGLAAQNPHLLLGGRLGLYQYFDMDDVLRRAMDDARRCLM